MKPWPWRLFLGRLRKTDRCGYGEEKDEVGVEGVIMGKM